MAEGTQRPTVYVETTIPSYLTSRPRLDLGKSRVSGGQPREREFKLYVSSIVIDEASQGDATAAQERLQAIRDLDILPENREISDIAEEYIQVLQIPPKAIRDALHVAYAVSYKLDYLVTWNLRHLASSATMKRLTEHNLSRGWHIPLIVTPEYFLPDDEEFL